MMTLLLLHIAADWLSWYGAAVRRRTRDRKVSGSTPGLGAIKSTRSTQPSIPPRSVNQVPAWMVGVRRGAFTCVGWQVTLCDPTWQVTSRSSEMKSYIGLYLFLLWVLPSKTLLSLYSSVPVNYLNGWNIDQKWWRYVPLHAHECTAIKPAGSTTAVIAGNCTHNMHTLFVPRIYVKVKGYSPQESWSQLER